MKLENEKSKNPFIYALRGIKATVKTEKNFRFDVIVALLVVIFGFIFRISFVEWIVCLLLIGIMLFAEMINTAIEAVVDMYTREKNSYAEKAKDIAAGAVFVLSIFSAIIGIIIFFPKVLVIIQNLM